VALITQTDGTLLITANINHDKVQLFKEIDVDQQEISEEFFLRSLIGSYMIGYNVIKIASSSKFQHNIRKNIILFINSVIGFEIVEETMNSIVIKDLLNPMEMPFEKSIKRMSIIARSMHEDAIIALKNKDQALTEEIIDRDLEINKRYRLIARQSNMILHDVILSQKMGVSLEDAHQYFLIGKQLERIGDHAKFIANHIMYLLEKDFDQKLITIITNASEASLKSFNLSLESWDRRDINIANQCIDSIINVRSYCKEITEYGMSTSPDVSIHLSYIEEGLSRTGEYAVNIAEIVFDKLLKK
jgi:phosphate uptake regulator